MLLLALAIVGLGIAASVAPYRDWKEAQARVAAKEEQVALLETQNAALSSEIHRLRSEGYLEALARKELIVGRPGEEVFVVSGVPETTETTIADVPARPPGPVERLVTALRGLF